MGEWWAAGPCALPPGRAGVTRVAAIDCGTNSIRLLVADVPAAGRHTDLLRRMEVVRLGQGVDATGRLAPEAIERTARCWPSTRPPPATSGPRTVRMVATSATRDAANRADFEDMVLATLGAAAGRRPRREEAELSFLGATASLDAAAEAHGPRRRAALPGRRHRRRLDGVRARERRRRAGGPLGRHRLRAA